MVTGWAKVKDAARFSGVSERTFREWLKDGLRHSRLNTGTILIKYDWIDAWLGQFEDTAISQVDAIVDEVGDRLKFNWWDLN